MKKSKYLFFEKKEDLRPFFIAKSEKTYKKYFSHQPVLVRNGILNRGPFAEVESTIRPLPLARLIKSAMAPLLYTLLRKEKEGVRTPPQVWGRVHILKANKYFASTTCHYCILGTQCLAFFSQLTIPLSCFGPA